MQGSTQSVSKQNPSNAWKQLFSLDSETPHWNWSGITHVARGSVSHSPCSKVFIELFCCLLSRRHLGQTALPMLTNEKMLRIRWPQRHLLWVSLVIGDCTHLSTLARESLFSTGEKHLTFKVTQLASEQELCLISGPGSVLAKPAHVPFCAQGQRWCHGMCLAWLSGLGFRNYHNNWMLIVFR